MKTKTYTELKESILNNTTTHYSLKDMINRLENTDIVDNYYDVKILLDLCILRLKESNVSLIGGVR